MTPEQFKPGLRIGNYVVERELARGGQGVVLSAKHASLGTRVAVKLLFERDPESCQRFLLEAKTLARLQHENLPRVSDQGQLPNGIPYLVMDFVTGEDLASWVRTKGVPTHEATVEVLVTLARVLHYCHEQGVVHRDVKPQNVMIEEGSGRVLLVDFGLVKRQRLQLAWSTQDMRSLTEDGEILGTPAYMAPEQVSSEFGKAGPASDVYALGALLFFLLTGEKPFAAGSLVNALLQVVEAPPPDPRALDPKVPPALARLCQDCLAKRPSDRPPSAEAVATRLEQALQSGRATSGLLASGLALLVLAGGGASVWALEGQSPSLLPEATLAQGTRTPTPTPTPTPRATESLPAPTPSPYPTPAEGGFAKTILGISLLKSDPKRALLLFQEASAEGDLEATTRLGKCYLRGIGTENGAKFPDKGMTLLVQAAALGYPPAMTEAGHYYRNNVPGGERNGQARKWFRRAAEAGHPKGMLFYGDMLRTGKGGEKDFVEALTWLRKAAAADSAMAMFTLAEMLEKGQGVDGPQVEEAKEWYRKTLRRQTRKSATRDKAEAALRRLEGR